MTIATVRRPAYRFRLECWKDRGRPLLELALERPHFERAVQATFFEALRQGLFEDYLPPTDGVRIVPRFAEGEPESPHTTGFRVVLSTPGGDEARGDFGTTFFRSLTRARLAQQVIETQQDIDGAVTYRLSAYLEDETPALARGLLLEDDSPAVPIREIDRAALGRAVAWDRPRNDDLSVVFERHVLDDALDTARAAPEREVGGFLLGHLGRDRGNRELFLHVTAHVPAERTEADQTSVTFTGDTWGRVREVVELRDEGEIIVGWVHSHPFRFCAECPSPPKPECVDKVLFYSPDDIFLMEQTFPLPFAVGLQTAVEPRLEAMLGHAPVRLYGWRRGEVVPRGFEVLP